MPTLSIKNVPENVLSRLRERAARNHRSIQGELMALLAAAVQPATEESKPVAGARPLSALAGPLASRSGTRRIEDIAAEHRQRQKRPLKQAPLAVELIRADRDAR